MIDYDTLIAKATMLRKDLGEIGSGPIDIFAMAHGIEGLTIVFYPFGEKLSGMCVKGQDGNNLIAINSSMTLGRQRFSLAHEFYHLYYDKNMISVCAKTINSGLEIEKAADMFASYFLMPVNSLYEYAEKLSNRNADKKLSLDDVIRIEQFFGVSHQAAVVRLMHTKFLSKKDGEDFLKEPVRLRAEALGFSSDLYKCLPEEKQYTTLGNYISMTESAFSKGLISEGKYEELLLDAFRSDIVYGSDGEEGEIVD